MTAPRSTGSGRRRAPAAGPPAPRRPHSPRLAQPPPPAEADALEPRRLLATFTVTTTADAGPGSLRQAILDANAGEGADDIRFALGGDAGTLHSIRPLSALPPVTGPTIVDATTQPGYQGAPLVELDGTAAGPGTDGLLILTRPSVVRGLVINRFARHGVVVRQTDATFYNPIRPFSVIDSCRIGTDGAGQQALPNGGAGVLIDGPGVTVGGRPALGRTNVISGNALAGVWVVGTMPPSSPSGPHVLIAGNVIGTNSNGDLPLGNGREGVLVESSFGVHVNTYHPLGVPGATNVISGNGASGVRVNVPTPTRTAPPWGGVLIFRNVVGTDASGTRPIPNGTAPNATHRSGVSCEGSGSVELLENTISGNRGDGVTVIGSPGSQSTVVVNRNRIGTTVGGDVALGNAGHGISADTAYRLDVTFNTISGNRGSGVVIAGYRADRSAAEGPHALLSGNKIGTNQAVTAALGNGGHGVELRRTRDVTVGGPNLLYDDGPRTFDPPENLLVAPYIFQNVISGNVGHGILATSSGAPATGSRPAQSSNIVLLHNLVGTDVRRTFAIGNNGSGIRLEGVVGARIGGVYVLAGETTPVNATGNTVAGNGGDGISIAAMGVSPSLDNLVENNDVGLIRRGDRVIPFGNGGAGIVVSDSSGNTIGGAPAADRANTVAFNVGGGVVVHSEAAPAERNRISANAIYANGGPGIDLGGDGVTPNDPLDADPGPNGLQNFPVIAEVVPESTSVLVRLRLSAAPRRTYRIELFASSAADPSGHGEGQRFLAQATVTTDANGDTERTIRVALPQPGTWLTATATDPDGNTSEFSPAVSALRTRPVFRPGTRSTQRAASPLPTAALRAPDVERTASYELLH